MRANIAADSRAMLEGVRVLEVSTGESSTGVATAFCARLFADHGADVILAEPPGGSPLRRSGPFGPIRGPLASELFWHLNTAKRSIVIDLSSGADTAIAQRLAARCHVVVTDQPLAAEKLARAVGGHACLVTDFGVQGPWAAWTADELVHQALGGAMSMTGTADGPPLYGFGERAGYAAGVAAYISCLAALLSPGDAESLLRISVHEVVAAMAQNLTSQFRYSCAIERREASRRPSARIRARDGWVVLFVMPGDWEPLCSAIGAPSLAADGRFASYVDLVAHWPQARAELQAACGSWRARELAAALAESGIAARQVATPAELPGDPDLTARSFWGRVCHDSANSAPPLTRTPGPGRLVLGPLARYEGWHRRLRPAPEPDQHRSELLALLGDPPLQPVRRRRSRQWPPLHDIRVLDLTSAWSGPMATRILAWLGATVVKVEAPQRMDGWRGQLQPSDRWMYPDGEPGERPYNRNAWFNTQNTGKRSVVLDLATPAGRAAGHALALRSDIVIANGKPGMLGRLGLDSRSLAAPRLIVAEMPAYGAGCPSARHRALGPTMEAATGFTHFIGYRGGPPLGSGPAYLDPMGALHGAATVLTALVHRQRTGRGITLEVAQREAAMHWIGEWLLEAANRQADRLRIGNEHPWHCPHGAYRCAGRDEWVAISVRSGQEWQALATVMGRADLAADPELADAAGRKARQAELDALIGQWTAGFGKWELTRRLQAAGVRAGAVADARDLSEDQDLRACGFFICLRHPEAGCHEYPGLPFRGFTPGAAAAKPAPCFGSDTQSVLRDWAGLDDGAINGLFRAGICSDRPVGAR